MRMSRSRRRSRPTGATPRRRSPRRPARRARADRGRRSMPAQLRVVRRRIRSVQSTMKITRAQELIVASRLVRAQQRVEQSRPYTRQLTHALSEIATTEGRLDHPLLERRPEVRAAAVLVITSDRGFAGPYNANVLR